MQYTCSNKNKLKFWQFLNIDWKDFLNSLSQLSLCVMVQSNLFLQENYTSQMQKNLTFFSRFNKTQTVEQLNCLQE